LQKCDLLFLTSHATLEEMRIIQSLFNFITKLIIFLIVIGFISGIVKGITDGFSNSIKYNGHTAKEWSDMYNQSQNDLDNWKQSYSDLTDCIDQKKNQWDYSNTQYTFDNIYTGNYDDSMPQADSGWIYSGFDTNPSTSPTDEMANCETENPSPTGY